MDSADDSGKRLSRLRHAAGVTPAAALEVAAENSVAGRSGISTRSTSQEQVLARIERARRRPPVLKDDRITLAHGAGGKATHTLIEALFLEHFRNPILEPLEDQAVCALGG